MGCGIIWERFGGIDRMVGVVQLLRMVVRI